MSIEREYGQYIPTCDICFQQLPGEDSFQDAVDAKKRAGWQGENIVDYNTRKKVWKDYCPDCFGKRV